MYFFYSLRLNFIFYGISCQKYREELFKILTCFVCVETKIQKDVVGQNVLLKPLDHDGKSVLNGLRKHSAGRSYMTTTFNDIKDQDKKTREYQ
jgi:hypothetical protein